MQESAFALFLHACYARNFKNKQTKIKTIIIILSLVRLD